MTREEQITSKAGSIADGCIAHSAPWKEYYQGFIEGAKWADANPSQPPLSSNLDEAAQKVEDYYDVGDKHGYLYCHRGDIKDAFKAGAEWMAGQGVLMEITDETKWADVDTFVHRNCDGATVIQIRKK